MATAPAPEAVAAAGPMVPAPHRVVRRRRETVDTWTLTVERPDRDLPDVLPGQFMMVYAFGIGEVPISLSGTGKAAGTLAHTVRAVGPVTNAICRARPGETVLGLRGPFGNAWPVDDARGADVVLVAGGIGLAPLRPALLAVLEHRVEYGNVVLLYGARTPADLLYRRELERWRAVGVDVDVTVDLAEHGWTGSVGVVPKLIGGAPFEPASTIALVCGPEIMMRFSAEALEERGVPVSQIHVSLERNMQCGLGHCGHCQVGPTLVCRDGPIYPWQRAGPWLGVREL